MKITVDKRAGCVGALVLVLFTAGRLTAGPGALVDSPEEMLFGEIPTVYTAGRIEQPLAESPAAMYVLTAEDIRQSGATQLGEALMSVPGLNIRRGTAGSLHTGGIRGLMKLPMNKVILMFDGMPWLQESYSDPVFSVIPISLAEIDKIEILKGPGSSLYGSNAMTGVINVVTKKTDKTRGTFASYTGGEYRTGVGTLMQGGKVSDRLEYRATFNYNQRDNFGGIPYAGKPTQAILMGNAVLDYSLTPNARLTLRGGSSRVNKSEVEFETSGPIDYGDSRVHFVDATLALFHPGVTLRSFWQDKNLSKRGYALGARNYPQATGEKKVEFQHTFRPFEKNTMVWGADALQSFVDADFLRGRRRVDCHGVFFDDNHRLTGKISVNAGARYDHNQNTANTYSHRLAAVLFPHPDHRLRFTWGSSFRNPDYIESYYYARTVVVPPLYYELSGHNTLKPEKAESYEASYMATLPKLRFEANAYTMNVRNFVFFKTTSYWPGLAVPRTLDFINGGRARIWGEELEMRYAFTRLLSGLVNYTHIYQKEIEAPAQDYLTQTPKNMANAKLQAKFTNGLSANVSLNYVDSTLWRTNAAWSAGGKAKAYTVANSRVAYEFPGVFKGAELAVSVDNIFDKKHDEYPIATQKVGRRAAGTVACRF